MSLRSWPASTPLVSLQRQVGGTSDVVRVVSIHSTKGFEFKQVLRAHIDPRPLDADQADPSEIEQERRWRERRDLYVEMTRARHRLGITVRSGATRSR